MSLINGMFKTVTYIGDTFETKVPITLLEENKNRKYLYIKNESFDNIATIKIINSDGTESSITLAPSIEMAMEDFHPIVVFEPRVCPINKIVSDSHASLFIATIGD